MGQDPKIPDNGTLPDDSGYSELDAKKQPEGDPTPDKAGEAGDNKQDPANPDKKTEGERPMVSQEQFDKLAEGWKEDREYMQGEIKRLRGEANSTTLTSKEEDELEGLDEKERVEKIISMREAKKKALEDAEIKAVQSEIRFYERTSKEFADNKQAILKVAEEYNCRDLKQAILIFRGISKDTKKKDAEYHNERKKQADGKAGGKSGGKTGTTAYNPKTDANKSFGDFFREGGVK